MKIKQRALVYIIGQMEVYIKVIGLIFKWKVKENLHGPIKVDTSEDIKMVLKMDKVYLQIKKIENLMDYGSKEKKNH